MSVNSGLIIGGVGGAVVGAAVVSSNAVQDSGPAMALWRKTGTTSVDFGNYSLLFGAIAGGLLGAIGGRAVVSRAMKPAVGPMSDAEKKVVDLRLKMAQIAKKALWRTMGRPGDVPWWFKDARIAQDRDGNYFLKGIISDKLPMDDTGWPYGLPHTSEGVKVVAERENPNSVEPVKLGPT